ncbi:MAG TPA: hypothetical protein DER40_06800 [Geobacter sp.]|nr:hypothetical protein [Geobacter sp.]HCE67224.1 hypothetical protein [Geobacter sp.]
MNADTNVMATFTKIPAPSAAFMAAPAVNLNVQFTDTSTGNPTSWLWDFGDGGTSTSQNPSHTYANSGTYSVSLTASNITGSNTFITYIGVTAPGSSRLTFAPVPDSDQITKTNVLINQAYVNLYPELMNETLVRAMFSDINAVIAKDPGNKKRYELNKLIVYPDSDFNTTTDNVTNNPIYFSDNNFVSNPSFGGATLLLWYYTGSGQDFINNKPKFFVENGNGTGYNTVNMINGKKYSMSYIARTGAEDYLLILRDSPLTYVNGFGAHDAALGGVLHELVGHGGAGLGYPEEYSLNFVDNSGTLPNLGVFDFTSLFPTDSMGKFDVVKYNILENRFNDLNYYFIGNNPVSQFDLYQISNVVKTMTIKVKVVDAFGNPVPAAVVTSYGGVAVVPGTGIGSPQNMIALLETLTTDANGMATLTNDFNVSWFAKGIKAVKGPQLGGAVLTSVDLKKAYWMQNINEHFMDITIQ